MARIIVIDDEPQIRSFLAEVLTVAGHDVEAATDGYSGLAIYRREAADVVITDIYMPGMDGVETVDKFHREFPDAKIIAISGSGGASVMAHVTRLGASTTLMKPFKINTLLAAVRSMLPPDPVKPPQQSTPVKASKEPTPVKASPQATPAPPKRPSVFARPPARR